MTMQMASWHREVKSIILRCSIDSLYVSTSVPNLNFDRFFYGYDKS